jgi:hypothetical protein
VTSVAKRVPAVQLAAIAVTTATAVIAVVYWVKALSDLGASATANSRLSYADREVAGGNSVVLDQRAPYRARALIPPRARYRVVTGGRLEGATALTRTFVGDWFRYFLMPLRPAAGARWVVCYGCELGSRYVVRWRGDDGISIGLLR